MMKEENAAFPSEWARWQLLRQDREAGVAFVYLDQGQFAYSQEVRLPGQPVMGLRLPLGLALGSPIFPSRCERNLGVALGSLQG